jgi:hypothetical protein
VSIRKGTCDQHAPNRPTPIKKGPVDVIIQKRGEPGTRRQASPDPRTTTDLNQKSRVVA